jgi:hypothetical protein
MGFLILHTVLSELFLIIRRIEEIWSKVYIGIYVEYPLLSTDFQKNNWMQNSMIIRPVQPELFRADGQTDTDRQQMERCNETNSRL